MPGELSEKNKRMKELRKVLKLSQRHIASEIGVKQSYYSDVENGRRNLTEKISESLKNVYKINTEWLYTGKGNMFTPESDKLSTPNAVPLMYPNETKEQESDSMSISRYRFKYDDYIRENLPEYYVLTKNIVELFELEDVLQELQESKIGKAIYFGMNERQYKNFEEYKSTGVQLLKEVFPHKDIIHQFASFAGEFIAYLNAHKEELNYDMEPYIDLEELIKASKK